MYFAVNVLCRGVVTLYLKTQHVLQLVHVRSGVLFLHHVLTIQWWSINMSSCVCGLDPGRHASQAQSILSGAAPRLCCLVQAT